MKGGRYSGIQHDRRLFGQLSIDLLIYRSQFAAGLVVHLFPFWRRRSLNVSVEIGAQKGNLRSIDVSVDELHIHRR
ncbi:hypothetical protein PFISCL1PPCAC_25324, partial [Pristionchus fissidentatus]